MVCSAWVRLYFSGNAESKTYEVINLKIKGSGQKPEPFFIAQVRITRWFEKILTKLLAGGRFIDILYELKDAGVAQW